MPAATLRPTGPLNVEHVSSFEPGSRFVLDLRGVTWTYPSGLVAVACLARDAGSFEVIWPDDTDQRNYLSRTHLDQILQELHPGVPSLRRVRHRQAELAELAFFDDLGAIDRLADLVHDHATRARIPSDWSWAFQEGTWEICTNALTHSEWGGGFLAAQHYGQRGEIEYAVADGGVGIRRSLSAEYPDLADDTEAILKAREYGTSRFGENRQGAGLAETVDQVTRLGGIVVIRSGDALVTFRGEGHTTRFSAGPWNGTLVKVVLPLPR